jgi:hypothetical protein
LQVIGGVAQASFTTHSLSLGRHTFSASYGGDNNFNPSDATPIPLTVIIASDVASVQINDGGAQRSRVVSMTITFTTTVTLDPAAIEVVSQSSGQDVGLNLTTSTVNTVSGPATQVFVTFTGSSTSFNSLIDGNYTLIVHANLVTPTSTPGVPVGGPDFTSGFWRLFGDVFGTRQVDNAALAVMNSALNTQGNPYPTIPGFIYSGPQDPNYVWYLDYDGNGAVNSPDDQQFLTMQRYGFRLDVSGAHIPLP